jgi:hypothetical protein
VPVDTGADPRAGRGRAWGLRASAVSAPCHWKEAGELPYNRSMGTRAARLGFVGYALSIGLGLGLGVWHQHLLTRLRDAHGADVTHELSLISAAFIALEVLGIVALIAITRLPASTGVRRLVIASAACAALGLVIGLSERWLFDSRWVSSSSFESVLRLVNLATALVHCASDLLLAFASLRLARAARSQWLVGVAVAAMVSRVVVTLLVMLPYSGEWRLWLYRSCELLFAVMCAGMAAVVTNIASEAPAPASVSDGKLAAQWRAPAEGIALYLYAAGARVLFALLGWLAMSGARGASGVHELHDVRGQVLLVAALSAAAGLVMLGAMWRISRAPVEANATAPALAALALGTTGLFLDGWSTSITADALDGNLSAAFFAMRALPVLGAVGALLGVGTAVALLRAFANLATALTCPDLAAHARSASGLVIAAGSLLVIGVALLNHATELLLVVVILAVPLAVAALVQFLRAALGVARVIRERSA